MIQGQTTRVFTRVMRTWYKVINQGFIGLVITHIMKPYYYKVMIQRQTMGWGVGVGVGVGVYSHY